MWPKKNAKIIIFSLQKQLRIIDSCNKKIAKIKDFFPAILDAGGQILEKLKFKTLNAKIRILRIVNVCTVAGSQSRGHKFSFCFSAPPGLSPPHWIVLPMTCPDHLSAFSVLRCSVRLAE